MSRDIDDLGKVYYCSRCFSLDIRDNDNGIMYCHHCGADIYKIDICDFERWEQLYTEKFGHAQIEQKTIYDDLAESFNEDTPELLTADEALTNGLCVGDFLQRKIKD